MPTQASPLARRCAGVCLAAYATAQLLGCGSDGSAVERAADAEPSTAPAHDGGPAGAGSGTSGAGTATHDAGSDPLPGTDAAAGHSPAGGASAGAGGPGGASGADAGTGTPGAALSPESARVDNPYADAQGYVDPEWRQKASAEPGGARIADTPTAVWLDRIAAIHGASGSMGLAEHLDAALAQRARYIQFVIYDLPGRDCSALASNGELGPDDLPRYKAEYIDPIVAIMQRPAYAALRIINIIEVDSLPNLVTNTNVEACAKMKSNGGYVDGVAYALQRLGSLPNTYNYLDAGHHGWLGWDSNLGPSAELFAQTAQKAGMQTVQGFITNTANYSALLEPFFDAGSMVGGTSVRQSKWLDWNNYADEQSFAQGLRQKLISLGFDASIGMLIDTSRNGWGGPARPSAKSSASDVDSFVNQSRIDRRIHAGNWCNQAGAGLGERPRANPAPGLDAYVWIKPPGESDGASSQIANDQGKGFDRMCDPSYGGNARNGNSATGALPDAPLSGAWFGAQFQELMRNAYPPL